MPLDGERQIPPLIGPLIGPLTGPLTGPLIGPLTGPLIGPLTGPLIGPLTARHVGRFGGVSRERAALDVAVTPIRATITEPATRTRLRRDGVTTATSLSCAAGDDSPIGSPSLPPVFGGKRDT